MTGIVLALAGLMCDDGGPGAGVARAPVAINAGRLLRFEGAWEGIIEGYGEFGKYSCHRVRVERGKIMYEDEGPADARAFFVIPEGGDRGRLMADGAAFPAVYKVEGGRVLVCCGWLGPKPPRPKFCRLTRFTTLFTLRPAAPRKP